MSKSLGAQMDSDSSTSSCYLDDTKSKSKTLNNSGVCLNLLSRSLLVVILGSLRILMPSEMLQRWCSDQRHHCEVPVRLWVAASANTIRSPERLPLGCSSSAFRALRGSPPPHSLQSTGSPTEIFADYRSLHYLFFEGRQYSVYPQSS